jgi:hypothetical protein
MTVFRGPCLEKICRIRGVFWRPMAFDDIGPFGEIGEREYFYPGGGALELRVRRFRARLGPGRTAARRRTRARRAASLRPAQAPGVGPRPGRDPRRDLRGDLGRPDRLGRRPVEPRPRRAQGAGRRRHDPAFHTHRPAARAALRERGARGGGAGTRCRSYGRTGDACRPCPRGDAGPVRPACGGGIALRRPFGRPRAGPCRLRALRRTVRRAGGLAVLPGDRPELGRALRRLRAGRGRHRRRAAGPLSRQRRLPPHRQPHQGAGPA